MVLYINSPLSHGTIKCKKWTLSSENPQGIIKLSSTEPWDNNPGKMVRVNKLDVYEIIRMFQTFMFHLIICPFVNGCYLTQY
jgi:hypothetical protein